MSDDTARAYAAAVEFVARCATDIAAGFPRDLVLDYARQHVSRLETLARDAGREDCAIAAQIVAAYVALLARRPA